MANDATTAFFEEELVKIISEVERVEYGKKIARDILPFAAKASRGSQALKQYVLDRVGYMKLKEKISDKVELTDISKTAVYLPLLVSENGFSYDIDEIAAAQEGGTSLDSEKAAAVLEAYEEMINKVAFVGQSDLGLKGLANNANVGIATDMGAAFSAATSEQRVTFFAGLCSDVYTNSNNTIEPNTLVIPSSEFVAMGEKTYSNSGVVTDKSELDMLQTRLNGLFGSVKIVSSLELAGQGAAGVQRAVAYQNSPRVLYFEETLPVEYQPVQRTNNVFKVPTFAKIGGLFVRRPYGIRYGDYSKA
jgi:hypothetical protein